MGSWLLLYELAGVCWFAFNLFNTHEFSARMRDRLFDQWRNGITPPSPRLWWHRPALVVMLVIFNQVWLVGLIYNVMPNSWTPGTNEKLGRFMRQKFLDRDGLMEPQMPATRCWNCGGACDLVCIPCAGCKQDWNVNHCKVCCVGGCSIERREWVCPSCAPSREPPAELQPIDWRKS